MIPWWLGLAAIASCIVLGALAVGAGAVRRAAAALVGVASLSVPFFVAGGPKLAITFCALFSVLAPIKILQLSVDPVPRSPAFRVWHAAMPFDARKTRPVERGLPPRAAALLALHGVTCLIGVSVALWAATLPEPTRRGVRLAAGIVGVYGGTQVMAALYVLGHRLIGVEVPPIMRAPILARSIAEFWSLRWNRAVHELLRSAFYAPLARRGLARTGVFAAFLGSAVLHFWIVVFTLGPRWALVMSGFFVVQGVLALVEDRLRVRRWRPAAARAWTLGTFALSAPLFVEPFLRALGI